MVSFFILADHATTHCIKVTQRISKRWKHNGVPLNCYIITNIIISSLMNEVGKKTSQSSLGVFSELSVQIEFVQK